MICRDKRSFVAGSITNSWLIIKWQDIMNGHPVLRWYTIDASHQNHGLDVWCFPLTLCDRVEAIYPTQYVYR
jgi:hypothetical protein